MIHAVELDIPTVREYLRQASPESHVFIGCDSDPNTAKSATVFNRVIVIRKRSGDMFKGCKVFGETFYARTHGVEGTWDRLWREVEYSVEIAQQVRDIAEGKFARFETHLDLNESDRYRSNSVVGAAIGYVKALGLVPKIKPDAPAATAAAHSFTKIRSRMG